MGEPTGEISVSPEVFYLEPLLALVSSGQLRVPAFQRPFIWRPDQMLHLYDSIERGYPIGSLLVWQTTAHLPSLGEVAGMEVPPAPPGKPVSYLLDGQQRLSTLFGSLIRRPGPPTDPEERQWWIYRQLGETATHGDYFRHWTGTGPPPVTYLPMQAVLRTMDFLAYAKRLTREVDDAELLIEEAERLAQRVKSCQVAVIRLVGGDLSHAVEAFSRLNSAGQHITADQMVSALTYQPGYGESLADRITAVQHRLHTAGIGEIPREVIFRTVLAVAGEEDVHEARWGVLSHRVRDDLASAVRDAEVALGLAVRFLRYEAGVPLALLVPYPDQIMLLAQFFHLRPEPDPHQQRQLVRWFWATSLSGTIAEANGARMSRILRQMRDFAAGGKLDVDRHDPPAPPDWFDPDNGRVRAYLLWELHQFPRRIGIDGEVFDPVDEVARAGFAAYRPVVAAVYPWRDHPANWVILPTPPGVPVRDALVDLLPERRDAVLASHGIPPEALVHLRAVHLRAVEPEAAGEPDDSDEGDEPAACEPAMSKPPDHEAEFVKRRRESLAEQWSEFVY